MDMRRIMLYKAGDDIFWHDPVRDIAGKHIVIQTIRFFPVAGKVEVTADDFFHYRGTPDVFTSIPLHIVVPGRVKHGGYCIGPFATEDQAKAAGRRIYTKGEGWTTGVVFEERDDTAPQRTHDTDDVARLFGQLLDEVDLMADCEEVMRQRLTKVEADLMLIRISRVRSVAAKIRALVV